MARTALEGVPAVADMGPSKGLAAELLSAALS
jgi:hypothetical protein